MGICSSCDSKSIPTAKLILQDGRLMEFSYPVKVSYILQKYPSCFICNSDDMDFNDIVSAVKDNEELQFGQLYFALGMDKLNKPIRAEEMAALAVKASSALAKNGGGGKCGCCRSSLCESLMSGDVRALRKVADDGGLRRKRGGKSGGKILSSIAE